MDQWIIIRDKKPEIPWWNPKRKTRTANLYEYSLSLVKKMDEEIQELEQAHAQWDRELVLEECADVYEVWLCRQYSWSGVGLFYPRVKQIVDHYAINEEEVAAKASEKRSTHGSFQEGILLDLATVLSDKK